MKVRSILFLATSAFVLTVVVTGASAQVAFDKPDFDVRSGPTLALDLNGDGITDVAAAVDGAIIVHLNPGNGTIGPGTHFPAGKSPMVMVAGDFNGDGIADLAELGADGTITVLLGRGDGTFSGPMSTATGATHVNASIAAKDLNGDGFDDVAFPTSDGNIFVLLGNGDGTFRTSSFSTGNESVRGIDAADFDGDGKADLAVVTCCFDPEGDGGVSILFGNGDGTFGPKTDIFGLSGPGQVTFADVNNDGIPDLIATFSGCRTGCRGLVVLVNNGDGTLRSAHELQTTHEPPTLPAIGDFNGDGIPDLAFEEEATIHVYFGNGDGSFTFSQNYPKGPRTLFQNGTLVGDFNGDGILDLAGTNANDTLTVLPGNGDGTFFVRQRFGTGAQPFAAASADFNGDGFPDVVVSNNAGNSVSVLLGNGDGTFQPKSDFTLGNLQPFEFAVGDFNDDGAPDLAVVDFRANTVAIMLNDGGGSLSVFTTLVAGNHPDGVAVGDFNGDGIADLAVVNQSDKTVSIFLGNGDGSFGPKMDFPAGGFPNTLVVADFNQDGVADLAIANNTGTGHGLIAILLGNGDGTFHSGAVIPENNLPLTLAVGDFNGDGISDLAWGVGQVDVPNGELAVALGNGDGTFGPASRTPITGGIAATSSADINGDGVVDLLLITSVSRAVNFVGSFVTASAVVLTGNGDGTFQPPVEVPAGSRGLGSAVADFNGDALPDIAVITSDDMTPTISILLNRSR